MLWQVEERHRFLVCHDYGMGGVWGYVVAPSAEAIRKRFPELRVFTEGPGWFTDESRDGLGVEDLDEPQPDELLGALLAQREIDRQNADK